MSLPGCRQRALDRIEQALVAEDPRLGSRFAVFTMLTRHEPMSETEQVPGRRQRFLRRAILLPLLAISLAALLAASWLMPSNGHACPGGLNMAAHALSSLRHAARCRPGPAIKLDTMPMH
jgi:hypothetical protein